MEARRPVSTPVRTPRSRRRPAVFLDRDGIINIDPGNGQFVTRWADFRFTPGIKAQLRRLRRAGFFLALVTNQSGVGRGLMPLTAVREVHQRMQRALGASAFDAIYCCPHHPGAGCRCRKPSPWMIRQACRKHRLDARRSFMVGDYARDVLMGQAAGCRAVLVNWTRRPAASAGGQCRPDFTARSVREAVDWLLRANQRLT